MGKISRFVEALRNGAPAKFTGEAYGRPVEYTVYNAASGLDDPEKLPPARMWKSQPHLRTVVDFQARAISQLALHLYTRPTEDETVRVRDGAIAKTLSRPNSEQTMTEVMYALVGDLALYDNAYLMVLPNAEGGKDLWPVPCTWVEPVQADSFRVKHYRVSREDGTFQDVKRENMLHFKGWTPADPTTGTSPVDTLRLVLAEQYSARVYRNQLWKKSGRTGGIIKRAKDAPVWDNTARRRFLKMWEAFTGNDGERAGEDVLLEDGMEYERVSLTAKEEQFVESTKLSLETVCQVYHVNPTMVGMLDNANYSNVREFRKGLYGDTLGPIIRRLEDRFNAFLLPMLGAGENDYVEFNVEQMLRGSFEEQAAVVSTSTGAPWQTRNEARKRFNMKPLPGGDNLIVPLNLGAPEVLEDDKPKMSADELLKRGNFAATLIRSGFDPNFSMEAAGLDPVEHLGLLPVTVQRPTEPADGEQVDQELVDEIAKGYEEVFKKFMTRQEKAVTARKGAGREDWFDHQRWVGELTADLIEVGMPERMAKARAEIVNQVQYGRYLDA